MYKLSPSDFKFLWKDCKHCYYRKIKDGIIPPAGAFPAIFTYMNNLLQNQIIGKNLQEIHSDLPNATVLKSEGFLKSAPILEVETCYISGRFDILCLLADNSRMLIDFKISNPKEENLLGYSSQLHAYKYALEHPANPSKDVENISRIGLITISPDAIKLQEGKVVFIANPVWHKFEINMEAFFALTKEIATLLDGPLPAPSETCKFCQYRQNAITSMPTILPIGEQDLSVLPF